MQLSPQLESEVNSLIYLKFTNEPPSRHELIKYSTWRAYLYNELETISHNRRDTKRITKNFVEQFPNLTYSDDRVKFYGFVFRPTDFRKERQREEEREYRQDHRNDNISHFICRMLYCQEEATQGTFVEMEKRILEDRLRRILNNSEHQDRRHLMSMMKIILILLKEKTDAQAYDISN